MSESATTVSPMESTGQGIVVASNDRLLPLDAAERVVVLRIRDSDSIRRHVFRRVLRADVDSYCAATTTATQRSGQTVENEVDVGSAELKLYERCAVRVGGYSLSDGRDLMQLDNWKSRVPGGHRIRVANLLMKVMRSIGSGAQPIDAEYDVVSLDAVWTEGATGSMDWYRGLLHRFAPPTDAHWRKFNNFKTRTVAVGGSRTQKTIYPRLDGVLADLYDELVVSVDGYSFQDAPLSDDKATICEQMDRFHKIHASMALFDRSESDSEDEEAGQK
jgi:hypothetical protein